MATKIIKPSEIRGKLTFNIAEGKYCDIVFTINSSTQLEVSYFDTNTTDQMGIRDITGIKFLNSNVYSTTEQRIGTWIDGKPLYQKTIDVGIPSGYSATSDIVVYSEAGDYDFAILDNGASSLYTTYSDGTKDHNASYATACYCGNNDWYATSSETVEGTLAIYFRSNNQAYTSQRLVVTIKYTKTTD